MTESAPFTPPEAGEPETGDDLGGLVDLLASLRSEEEPKTGSRQQTKRIGVTQEPTFQIEQELTLAQLGGINF